MLQLSDGPRSVREGPLGRCLKKGWCQRVGDAGEAARPIFALTLAGLNLLERLQQPNEGSDETHAGQERNKTATRFRSDRRP